MATEDTWTEYAESRLLGQSVAMVRYLTKDEAATMGWDNRPLVIQFEDGSVIFPSRDDEGNGAGTLFGCGGSENLPESEDPEQWTFPVLSLR